MKICSGLEYSRKAWARGYAFHEDPSGDFLIPAAWQYISTFDCLISVHSFLVANLICKSVSRGFKDIVRVTGVTPDVVAKPCL